MENRSMVKIAICDDETAIAGGIESLILEICRREGIAVDTEVFFSGEELEREFQKKDRYDLLYLDIQMKGENGIEAAKHIRKIDENVLLIYVSGYDKYLMELFRLDVFSFIKKPVAEAEFEKTLLDAIEKISSRNFYFTYRYKSEEHKIPCCEIMFMESSGRQLHIHLKSGETETFNGKLNDAEKQLSEGKVPFLRIHQSFLVNYHLIKSRSKTEVTLVNGRKLPISEDRQKKFSWDYGKLLGGEIDA